MKIRPTPPMPPIGHQYTLEDPPVTAEIMTMEKTTIGIRRNMPRIVSLRLLSFMLKNFLPPLLNSIEIQSHVL